MIRLGFMALLVCGMLHSGATLLNVGWLRPWVMGLMVAAAGVYAGGQLWGLVLRRRGC
jgi:hypothetical protein